ncbi:energy transducer TonB [Sphingobacterium thalpophilum]|uniref:energy transducer TonB n=1 Tax=Sphingobacterium thalpophilum TaxID=259 RepID=UPI003C73B9F0
MKHYLQFSAKLICSLLLIFYHFDSLAQVSFTTFHKQDGDETKQRDSAYFSRTVHMLGEGEGRYYTIEEFYTRNDSIKLKADSRKPKPSFEYLGTKYEFYEDGKLKSLENYSSDSRLIDSAFYLYPNNKLEMTVFYPNYVDKKGKLKIEKPIYVVYYDSLENKMLENGNGRIRFRYGNDYEEGQMINSMREGEWKGKFGESSIIENYSKDKLLAGVTTKASGEIIKYDSTTYRVNPQYPGGISRLMGFISSHYRYPKEALKRGVSGTVEIGFTVDKEGNVKNLVVEQDLGYGTGEEGIRVVKQARKWKPGIWRGEPVNVRYTLPIRLNSAR